MSDETIPPEPPDAAKDPLWRDLLEKMVRDGADYGKTYPMEFFEQGLREERDTPAFNFAMASLMAGFRAQARPMILTQRGLQGTGFMFLPAASNIGWLEERMRKVLTYSKEQVWVAANTPRELLSGREAAQMDALEAKAAARLTNLHAADRNLAKRLGAGIQHLG